MKKRKFLNDKALRYFSSIFYKSERSNEEYALFYWKKLEKIGFSYLCNENRTYNLLKKIFSANCQLGKKENLSDQVILEQINKLNIPIDSWKIILVNGHLFQKLNNSNFGPYKIKIMNKLNHFMKNFLNLTFNDEIFSYLTESLSIHPLSISLPHGEITKKPLYILNVLFGPVNNNDCFNNSYYRYHFDIGENSNSNIIEYFIPLDKNPYVVGSRVTINSKENSFLDYKKISSNNNQIVHFLYDDINVGKKSEIKKTFVFIGSNLFRSVVRAKMSNEMSKLFLNSLLLARNHNVFDIKTYFEHQNRYSKSYQLHKAVILDESKVLFDGLIKVLKNSFKTNSEMINNNLLFSKNALVKTDPKLEIYADDVKCRHGATIGIIDKEQLFYLRSRGISLKDAKSIIIAAFASEIIDLIDNDIKNKIIDFIYEYAKRI